MLAVFVRISVFGTKVQQYWFLPESLALLQLQREQLLARADALCPLTRSMQSIYKLTGGDGGFEFPAGFLVLTTCSSQQRFLPGQLFVFSVAAGFGQCVWVRATKDSLEGSLLLVRGLESLVAGIWRGQCLCCSLLLTAGQWLSVSKGFEMDRNHLSPDSARCSGFGWELLSRVGALWCALLSLQPSAWKKKSL